jgi:phosphoribosylformylglycinamidine cyclo-ligase
MTTYRDAGVDIDAGDEFVARIKPLFDRRFVPRS